MHENLTSNSLGCVTDRVPTSETSGLVNSCLIDKSSIVRLMEICRQSHLFIISIVRVLEFELKNKQTNKKYLPM